MLKIAKSQSVPIRFFSTTYYIVVNYVSKFLANTQPENRRDRFLSAEIKLFITE